MRRKRWEWREQALVALNLQAEAMSATSTPRELPPARSGRVFRPNNGGVNVGPPPMAIFKDMGFDVEM